MFAGLDGATLAFDLGSPDAQGEIPVWFLDREGDVAVLAGETLEEAIANFLVGGAIDRHSPPAPGGHWQLPATYVTEPLDRSGRDLFAELLLALRSGDDAAADAVIEDVRRSMNGYEASAELVSALLGQRADSLEPSLRARWIERAVTFERACAPTARRRAGIEAGVSVLKQGKPLDALVGFELARAAGLEALQVRLALGRFDLTSIEVTVTNGADTTSTPGVVVTATVPDDHDLERQRWELGALQPQESFPVGFSWKRPPRRVCVSLELSTSTGSA